MAATGQSLPDLAGVMTRLPQMLVNVPDVDKPRADEDAVLAAAVAEEEAELGEHRPRPAAPLGHRAAGAGDGRGRERSEQADAVAHRLADVVKTQLAL